jgi:transcriptional regulator with XRE-family HTH domain
MEEAHPVSPQSHDLDAALIALGRAINAIRKERGLRQEDLAERASLHESYISVLESGQRNPTWSAVRRISDGLEVPLSELARRAEEFERGERN